MEIITEPEFLESDVLMVEMAFLGSIKPLSYFLRSTDVISVYETGILLKIQNTRGSIEEVYIERRNLLWYSTVKTTIREKNPRYAKPVTEVSGPSPVQSTPTVVSRPGVGTIPAGIDWEGVQPPKP